MAVSRGQTLWAKRIGERVEPLPEMLLTPDEPKAFAAYHAIDEDARKALRYTIGTERWLARKIAAAMAPFWATRTDTSEIIRTIDRVIAHGPGRRPADRAEIFAASGLLHRATDPGMAVARLQEALSLAERARDARLVAHCEFGLALCAIAAGDAEWGTAVLQRALPVFQSANDPRVGLAFDALARLQSVAGDHDRALALLERGLSDVGDDGPPSVRMALLTSLARVTFDRGDPVAAHEHGKAALELAEELGHEIGIRAARAVLLRIERGEGAFEDRSVPAADTADRSTPIGGSPRPASESSVS